MKVLTRDLVIPMGSWFDEDQSSHLCRLEHGNTSVELRLSGDVAPWLVEVPWDRLSLKSNSGDALEFDIESMKKVLGLGLCCLPPDAFDALEACISMMVEQHSKRNYDL